jgi:hypothetical protein
MTSNIKTIVDEQNLRPIQFMGDARIRVCNGSDPWGPLVGPISATKMLVDPGKSSLLVAKYNTIELYGQIAGAIPIPGDPQISLTFDAANKNVLALGFRGLVATINNAGATVTNQVVAVPHLGSWLRFSHRNISSTGFSGKTHSDTVLVAGTDYVLNDLGLKLGYIWIPSDSSIPVNDQCKWSYTYGAVTGYHIDGAQLTDLHMNIQMAVVNRMTGGYGFVEVFDAAINPTSLPDLTESKQQDIQFQGMMVTPIGATAPFVFEGDLDFS